MIISCGTFLHLVSLQDILEQLLPLVVRSLALASKADEPDKFCSEIIQNVLGRLNAETSSCLGRADAWAAVAAAFKDQKTPILTSSGKIIRPAVVVCQQVSSLIQRFRHYCSRLREQK